MSHRPPRFGSYAYAWIGFIVLGFVLAFASLVPGMVFESAGKFEDAGGWYAFSAAAVSLAVTFAAGRPGNKVTEYIPITLAFAVMFAFAVLSNMRLSGLQLGSILLTLGIVQAIAIRIFLPEEPPAPRDQAKAIRQVGRLQMRLEGLQQVKATAVEERDLAKAELATAEARIAELEVILRAPLFSQLMRLARRPWRS